ncbi:MAG: hypothetical protein COV45_04840 [Deltaproteobacteria bacterium CG11_big_fil_rev_8_21_14_0_20_47_16]|nr:MAG: hypothetical protein COV45_04840 [Deltaproteobacteria bacterium CG11_big_fil_rev_8_21_14_0_20_47_16]
MARLEDESQAQQILEATYNSRSSAEGAPENPVVLSCGGIFIPQPRNNPVQYHILNTPSEESSAKVVSGTVPTNMLQLVMAKESLN